MRIRIIVLLVLVWEKCLTRLLILFVAIVLSEKTLKEHKRLMMTSG